MYIVRIKGIQQDGKIAKIDKLPVAGYKISLQKPVLFKPSKERCS